MWDQLYFSSKKWVINEIKICGQSMLVVLFHVSSSNNELVRSTILPHSTSSGLFSNSWTRFHVPTRACTVTRALKSRMRKRTSAGFSLERINWYGWPTADNIVDGSRLFLDLNQNGHCFRSPLPVLRTEIHLIIHKNEMKKLCTTSYFYHRLSVRISPPPRVGIK